MTQLRPFGAPPSAGRNLVLCIQSLPRRATRGPAFMFVGSRQTVVARALISTGPTSRLGLGTGSAPSAR